MRNCYLTRGVKSITMKFLLWHILPERIFFTTLQKTVLTRIKRMPWILINEENKKETILVPAFMQICSLTMSADKMRTTSKTYVMFNALSYYSPFLFFTSFYFFHSSRPFPRSFCFFLFISHWATLESVFVPLNTIEKKHRDSFDNFPGLERAFSDSLKKEKRKIAECAIHAGFFHSKYGYTYGHLREVSVRWLLMAIEIIATVSQQSCHCEYLNLSSWNQIRYYNILYVHKYALFLLLKKYFYENFAFSFSITLCNSEFTV